MTIRYFPSKSGINMEAGNDKKAFKIKKKCVFFSVELRTNFAIIPNFL